MAVTTPASGARISIERRASLFASFSSMSRILVFSASISSACRDRNRCELVLGLVQLAFKPKLAAFELLQFGLRLHPGLLARIQFVQRCLATFD